MAKSKLEIEVDLVAQQAQANAKALSSSIIGISSALQIAQTALTAIKVGFDLAFDGVKAIAGAFTEAVRSATEFEAAMAEVQTLFGSMSVDSKKLSADILAVSNQFGTDRITATKAYYQAISSGAVDASSAQGLLVTANKLAVGGVTDLATAVDGITNVLNGWNLNASEAASVSDTFFIAMQKGKTTVGEMASELNKASPNAAALGIDFKELAAAASALTLSGTPTSVAFTQLKAVMANLQKPTEDLQKAFKAAGITSIDTALKTDGLKVVLDKLVKTTDGTATGISKLWSSTEAGGAALALSGSQAEAFGEILNDMKQAAKNAGDTTETAFKKIEATVDFQSKRASAQLSNLGVEIGAAFLPVVSELLTVFNEVGELVIKFVQDNKKAFEDIASAVIDFIKETKKIAEAVTSSDAFKDAIGLLHNAWTTFAENFMNHISAMKILWEQTFSLLTQDSKAMADLFNVTLSVALRNLNDAFKLFAISVELAMKSIRDIAAVTSKVMSVFGSFNQETRKAEKSAKGVADAIAQSTKSAASAQSTNQLYTVSLGKVFKATNDVAGAQKKGITTQNETVKATKLQGKASDEYTKKLIEQAKLVDDNLRQTAANQMERMEDERRNWDSFAKYKGDVARETAADIAKIEEAEAKRRQKVADDYLKALEDLDKMKEEAAKKEADRIAKQIELDKKAADERVRLFKEVLAAAKEVGAGIATAFTGVGAGVATLASGDIFGGLKQGFEATLAGLGQSLAGLGKGAFALWGDMFSEEMREKIGALAGFLGDAIGGAISTTVTLLETAFATVSNTLQTAFKAVSGGFIADLASGVKGILGSFEANTKAITEGTEALKTFDTGIFGDISKVVDEFITSFVDNFARIIDEFVASAPRIIDSLVQGIPKIVETLAANAGKIIKALASAIGPIIKAVISAIPTIAKALSKEIPGLIKSLAKELPNLVRTLVKEINKMSREILPAFIKLISQLIQEIIRMLPDIIDTILQIIPYIINEIPKIVQALVNAIPGIITAIMDNLPAIIISIVEAIPQIINAIILAIPTIIQSLINSLPKFITSLTVGIIEAFPRMVEQLWTQIGNGIGDFVSSLWKGIKDVFNFEEYGGQIWNGLKNAFRKFGDWLADVGGKIWDGIGNAFYALGDWLADVGEAIWNGIEAAFGSLGDWLADVGKAIWNGIKSAFGSLGGWLAEVGSKIWEGVKSAFTSTGDWLADLGKKIWEGFKSGFSEIGEAFKGSSGNASTGTRVGVGVLTGGISEVWGAFSLGPTEAMDSLQSSASTAGAAIKTMTNAALEYESAATKAINRLPQGGTESGRAQAEAYIRDFLGDTQQNQEYQRRGTFASFFEHIISQASSLLYLSKGGMVGGTDSLRYDTVPAMLSPGELVVPRSAVAGGMGEILRFASETLGNGRQSSAQIGMARGGIVESARGSMWNLANEDLGLEIRELRTELRQIGYAVAKYTQRTAEQLVRWDVDGLPEERVL
jgi:TP901 family phage tail tape measure protein